MKILSSFSRGQLSSRSKSNMSYFQEVGVSCDREGGREPPGLRRERPLEEPPQSPRHKTPQKGKLKATLTDIHTPQDSSKRLGKNFDRLDVKLEQKEELLSLTSQNQCLVFRNIRRL